MSTTGLPTTTLPIWFGSEKRPLFGWFNAPADSTARAGVVICPPLGRDYLHAHYALRLLAEGLAEQGFCVLRFDYDGTGDSAGDHRDPERVRAWTTSVKAAIERVRAGGVDSIFVVGMRLGALLAGIVAEQDGNIAGLVLWDPAVSGRAYLREQGASSALSFGLRTASTDGSVEAPGMVFDRQAADDLRSLDLVTTRGPLADRVLALIRPDRDAGRLRTRLDLTHVEWSEAVGQAELMDAGSLHRFLPWVAISRIIDWLAAVAPEAAASIDLPFPAGSAVVARDPGGMPIVETPGWLGPAGLFGIWTEVPGRAHGPTMIFLSVAYEHRIGPGRLWVDLARRWAGAGLRSVRVDMSGLGDSPTRSPEQEQFVAGAPEGFDDVADAVDAASREGDADAGVVLVGLCASGYQALESALRLRPRGVIAVNPVLSFQPPELASGEPLDPRRRIVLNRNQLVEAFHGDGALSGLRRRYPNLGWRLRMMARPSRRSSVWLRQLTGRGVDLLIVCSEREARPIVLSATKRALERQRHTGRFRLAVIPNLEHGLLIAEQRAAVSQLTTDHVLEHFAGASGAEKPLEVIHYRV